MAVANDLVVRFRGDDSHLNASIKRMKAGLESVGVGIKQGGTLLKHYSQNMKESQQAITNAGTSLTRFSHGTNQLGAAISQAGMAQGRFNSQLKQGQSALTGFGNQVSLVRTAMQSLSFAFVSLFTVSTARDIARTLDKFQQMQNLLRAVTKEGTNYGAMMDNIFQISQRTRSSMQGVTTVYSKLLLVQDKLGRSQEELGRISETIGKAITMSGSSAMAAQAALVQLGQAFGSGVLRGEELNSVMEQTPVLAQAIATGLGVSIGELRKMGHAGQLTAETVVGALERVQGIVDDQFANTIVTFGQGMTQLENAFISTIGKMAEANNVGKSFGQTAARIAENMESILSAATGIGAGVLALAFSRISAGLVTIASNAVSAKVGVVQLSMAHKAAMVENAAYDAKAASAAAARLAMERQGILNANQQMVVIKQKAAALKAEGAELVRVAKADLNRSRLNRANLDTMLARQEALNAAVAREAVLRNQAAAMLVKQRATQNATQGLATMAQNQLAMANAMGRASKNAAGMTTAYTRMGTAINVVGKGISGFVGLLGGWAGIAITGAAALGITASNMDLLEASTKRANGELGRFQSLALALKEVFTSADELKKVDMQMMINGFREAGKSTAEAKTELDYYNRELERMNEERAKGRAGNRGQRNSQIDAEIKRMERERDARREFLVQQKLYVSEYDRMLGQYDEGQRLLNSHKMVMAEIERKREAGLSDQEVSVLKEKEMAKYAEELKRHEEGRLSLIEEYTNMSEKARKLKELETKETNQLKIVEEALSTKIAEITDKYGESAEAAKLIGLAREDAAEKERKITTEAERQKSLLQYMNSQMSELLGEYSPIIKAQNEYNDAVREAKELKGTELETSLALAGADNERFKATAAYTEASDKAKASMDNQMSLQQDLLALEVKREQQINAIKTSGEAFGKRINQELKVHDSINGQMAERYELFRQQQRVQALMLTDYERMMGEYKDSVRLANELKNSVREIMEMKGTEIERAELLNELEKQRTKEVKQRVLELKAELGAMSKAQEKFDKLKRDTGSVDMEALSSTRTATGASGGASDSFKELAKRFDRNLQKGMSTDQASKMLGQLTTIARTSDSTRYDTKGMLGAVATLGDRVVEMIENGGKLPEAMTAAEYRDVFNAARDKEASEFAAAQTKRDEIKKEINALNGFMTDTLKQITKNPEDTQFGVVEFKMPLPDGGKIAGKIATNAAGVRIIQRIARAGAGDTADAVS